jgi:hypothetical protein
VQWCSVERALISILIVVPAVPAQNPAITGQRGKATLRGQIIVQSLGLVPGVAVRVKYAGIRLARTTLRSRDPGIDTRFIRLGSRSPLTSRRCAQENSGRLAAIIASLRENCTVPNLTRTF